MGRQQTLKEENGAAMSFAPLCGGGRVLARGIGSVWCGDLDTDTRGCEVVITRCRLTLMRRWRDLLLLDTDQELWK